MADKPVMVVPVATEPGQVVIDESGNLAVNVKGGLPDVSWLGSYTPWEGDNVRVLQVDGTAVVLGPVRATPPPHFGAVSVAAENGVIQVLGDDEVIYPCRYSSPEPAVGSRVALLWQGSQAYVLPGELASVPTDPLAPLPPAPPPPPASTSGVLAAPALWAGSWRSFGRWEPGEVRQGSYGSNPSNRGAWFYGGQVGQLAGRLFNSIRIYVGPRVRLGSFNASAIAHFYVTSGNSPHEWAPAAGPHDVAIPAGWGGGWIDLPPTWGTALIAGGGIGIQGNPYLGFSGGAPSGQLEINWRA